MPADIQKDRGESDERGEGVEWKWTSRYEGPAGRLGGCRMGEVLVRQTYHLLT